MRLAHPLYGEIVRARMPALTRRRLLLEHANRLEAHGARRREDPIRIARSRLDASGSADPELLVRVARLARYGLDFVQVAYAAHAAAAARGEPQGLVEATDRFEQLGAMLLAAEAAAEAAHAFHRAGERRSAAGLGARSAALLASCEGREPPPWWHPSPSCR